jgi:hypothetical protein
LQHLQGSQYFAKFDWIKGYWQCFVDEESTYIFAFSTLFGSYEFLRIPMGSINSGMHFQKCGDRMFREMFYQNLLTLIDDALRYAKTPEDLLEGIVKFF